MKAQEIKDRLASCGWTEDRFGHMKKDLVLKVRADDKTANYVERMVEHRIKFQKISIRFERLVDLPAGSYSGAKKAWFPKLTAYIKDIKLDDTGALAIGNYRFKPQ